MEEKMTYMAEEVARLAGCDCQSLRDQVKSDIAQGRNKQNWNARQVGNRLVFSKADVNNWLKGRPIGPELTVLETLANALIRLGMAKEALDEAD